MKLADKAAPALKKMLLAMCKARNISHVEMLEQSGLTDDKPLTDEIVKAAIKLTAEKYPQKLKNQEV